MAASAGLTYPDVWARSLGIFGSGFFFGCTVSTSTVLIPMIQNREGLSLKQRLELWDDQFTLSVTRWTPLGIVGAISYLYASYNWSGGPDYNSSKTLAWAGGAMLAMIPLTVVFIFPVVGKLKKMKHTEADSLKGMENEVQDAIKQWDLRHRGRILCSGICFALGIYDVARLLSR